MKYVDIVLFYLLKFLRDLSDFTQKVIISRCDRKIDRSLETLRRFRKLGYYRDARFAKHDRLGDIEVLFLVLSQDDRDEMNWKDLLGLYKRLTQARWVYHREFSEIEESLAYYDLFELMFGTN